MRNRVNLNAVLMTRVWNTPFNSVKLQQQLHLVQQWVDELPTSIELPWIDRDEETRAFVEYWFAKEQQEPLRRIAYVLLDAILLLLCPPTVEKEPPI